MRKLKLLLYIVVLAASGLLVACSSTGSVPVRYSTNSLEGLQSMRQQDITSAAKAASTNIRKTAIRETALSLGARAGLAKRSTQIDAQLEQQQRRLDKVFDFNMLMLPQNVVPPVLVQGRDTLNIADGRSLRLADRMYRIITQAHFVTTPPHWRDYLWMNFKAPEQPDNSLMPKNKQERAMWNYYVKEGWQKGIHQGNTIFADNLARLKQTFNGMVLYRTLLAQHMVSRPFVAKTDLGVTGDGSHININDQVLRITALPQLQVDSEQWKAAVSKDKNLYPKQSNRWGRQSTGKAPDIVISNNNWQKPPRK